MLEYSMADEVRAALKPHHRAFQAAVSVLANRRLGIERPARGIDKQEGGVRIGDAEIVIRHESVMDDWKLAKEPTTDEQFVVDAIAAAVALFLDGGAAALEAFQPCDQMYDPLRSMFDLSPGEAAGG